MNKAFKYGDNVDTDVIIPARYLNISNRAELCSHAMEDIDTNFVKTVEQGDIIVAGHNFGCGSSREHAPLVLKECGVSLIIAKSFARIFYRNAINIGLPIVECAMAADGIAAGDSIEAHLSEGEIHNLTTDTIYHTQPLPDFIMGISAAGGLIEYLRAGGAL